jgi:hypothetical protein
MTEILSGAWTRRRKAATLKKYRAMVALVEEAKAAR